MDFNQLILDKLHTKFTGNGFKIIEQYNGFVKYGSDGVVIVLSHNKWENSNALWVGGINSAIVEIDNQVLRDFFYSDTKLSDVPMETFVNNAFFFFSGEGEKLLIEDEGVLNDLAKFNEHRSAEFTTSLVNQQYLKAAEIAWQEKNYNDVIRNLDRVNKDSISNSLKQKYKIAHQRLNK